MTTAIELKSLADILAGNFTQTSTIEYIEDLIIDGDKGYIQALRLICLQSLVCNGLNARTWSEYQKLLVQVSQRVVPQLLLCFSLLVPRQLLGA
jgi:hypothetical protein